MENLSVVLVTLLLLFLTQKIWYFRRRRREVESHPNEWYFLSPAGVATTVLPKIKYFCAGNNWSFLEKYDAFSKMGAGYRFVTYGMPSPRNDLLLGDAAMIKEVTNSRTVFPKPVEIYIFLSFFGKNIVASEGNQWKMYRKIASPAFSERNNRMVWNETLRIVKGLFDEVWGHKKRITVDHFLDITLPLTLYVISSAGFGRTMTWTDENSLPSGHKMSFKQTLHIASTCVVSKALMPRWAMNLSSRFRHVRDGFDELKAYMQEMIREREGFDTVGSSDLLSNLLAAGDEGSQLTEDELIGNIYIFLLAGHETTAHTLAFAFALLALYPDKQEKLHDETRSLCPDGRLPTYDDMPKLTYAMAVFYETLRMFPSVIYIPKVAAEDTVLKSTNETGETTVLSVSKGSTVAILPPALHYNPRYWQDPHAFQPERFLKEWPRDAFLPFSGGPRACIGRKFAETEVIAALTTFICRYKVTIKEEPEFAHETFEQRKERVLMTTNALTLTPIRIPLVFTERN